MNANNELSIKQTRLVDAGIYQCVATNEGGQAIYQARLTLKGETFTINTVAFRVTIENVQRTLLRLFFVQYRACD